MSLDKGGRLKLLSDECAVSRSNRKQRLVLAPRKEIKINLVGVGKRVSIEAVFANYVNPLGRYVVSLPVASIVGCPEPAGGSPQG